MGFVSKEDLRKNLANISDNGYYSYVKRILEG